MIITKRTKILLVILAASIVVGGAAAWLGWNTNKVDLDSVQTSTSSETAEAPTGAINSFN